MRVRQVIARADALRPNGLAEEQKAAWVHDLDGQLCEMMGLPPRPGRWPEEDGELVMPFPHEELYQLYLMGRIDYYNQEMDLYANDMAIYNAALGEAQGWWRRHHRPGKRRGRSSG